MEEDGLVRAMQKVFVFSFGILIGISSAISGQKRTPSHPIHADKQADQIPEITSRALPAVVLVVAFDKSGQEVGQGSGFVVTHDGKVVTNYHVIENAFSAIIKSPSGAFYPVQGILGLDQDNDLVVLKASGKDFPILPLGNSASVRVGEQVIAIGSPLALEGTVSNGIVSAMREIKDGKLKVIQATAPISPGSSGGALLNLKGEVVGVTSYHLMPGENINFAIIVDYLTPLLGSNAVTPFHPKQEVAVETPEPQVQRAEKTPEIPRDWISLEDGEPLKIRIDGDHLYEFLDWTGNGTYAKEIREICDTKRQGSEWVGTCREKILLVWGSAVSETWCSLELNEKITSVSPSRIEGETQNYTSASTPSSCPSPGTGWHRFAYIPKD